MQTKIGVSFLPKNDSAGIHDNYVNLHLVDLNIASINKYQLGAIVQNCIKIIDDKLNNAFIENYSKFSVNDDHLGKLLSIPFVQTTQSCGFDCTLRVNPNIRSDYVPYVLKVLTTTPKWTPSYFKSQRCLYSYSQELRVASTRIDKLDGNTVTNNFDPMPIIDVGNCIIYFYYMIFISAAFELNSHTDYLLDKNKTAPLSGFGDVTISFPIQLVDEHVNVEKFNELVISKLDEINMLLLVGLLSGNKWSQM